MSITQYKKIIEEIYKELMTAELSSNIGLLSGTSGIALFIAYYDRIIYQKKDINPRIVEILEHNVEQINLGNWQHTICNGISGFGWLCEHLKKLEILTNEDIEFLDDLDTSLYNQMMADIKKGNYDYLHGALGVGTYFLSRLQKKEIVGYLEELLSELEKSAVSCENGSVKWLSELDHKTGKKGYNISLSHGMSSIAAFLIRLHLLGFETERVERLLTKTIMYIIDQITYTEGSISYFPSYSKESSGNQYSRLGWCYGDLGIAYTIYRTAIVLRNDEWEDIAIRVLRHNTKRCDLQENAIRDAGICHGSAGLAHIFENMYMNTQIQEFQETTDYWLHITIQMGKQGNNVSEFKAWRTEEYGGPIKSDTLLEGIAGIGLVLLSYIDKEKTSWNQALML